MAELIAMLHTWLCSELLSFSESLKSLKMYHCQSIELESEKFVWSFQPFWLYRDKLYYMEARYIREAWSPKKFLNFVNWCTCYKKKVTVLGHEMSAVSSIDRILLQLDKHMTQACRMKLCMINPSSVILPSIISSNVRHITFATIGHSYVHTRHRKFKRKCTDLNISERTVTWREQLPGISHYMFTQL